MWLYQLGIAWEHANGLSAKWLAGWLDGWMGEWTEERVDVLFNVREYINGQMA